MNFFIYICSIFLNFYFRGTGIRLNRCNLYDYCKSSLVILKNFWCISVYIANSCYYFHLWNYYSSLICVLHYRLYSQPSNNIKFWQMSSLSHLFKRFTLIYLKCLPYTFQWKILTVFFDRNPKNIKTRFNPIKYKIPFQRVNRYSEKSTNFDFGLLILEYIFILLAIIENKINSLFSTNLFENGFTRIDLIVS